MYKNVWGKREQLKRDYILFLDQAYFYYSEKINVSDDSRGNNSFWISSVEYIWKEQDRLRVEMEYWKSMYNFTRLNMIKRRWNKKASWISQNPSR